MDAESERKLFEDLGGIKADVKGLYARLDRWCARCDDHETRLRDVEARGMKRPVVIASTIATAIVAAIAIVFEVIKNK